MSLHVEERSKGRTENEKKGSRIVSELKQRIVADINDHAERQQIGCHNDGSGGTHNDN